MKDIKTIMIGFLLATCMILCMGQTMSNTLVGRYEIEVSHSYSLGTDVHEYNYFLFDTKEGKIVKFGKLSQTKLTAKVYEEDLIDYMGSTSKK